MAIAERGHLMEGRFPVALAVVVAVGTALRLILAAVTGPGLDETYIAVVSRDVAWGYVDHPPLAMWLAALARWTTGSEAIFILRLPFIALFAATTVLVYALADTLFGRTAALPAALALSLTPIVSIYFGTFVLTDGPFVFFLAAAAYCQARALYEERGRSVWWLATGALVGLALLSKYTAVFFPLGVGLFLLTQSRFRRWLLRPAPWLALALAAAIFAPVVVWNAAHGWVSFVFQGGRAEPGLSFEPLRLMVNLAIQSFYFFPPIWVGLLITLGVGFKAGPRNDRSWLIVWLAVIPIAFFALVWLVAQDDNKGFHWAAAGFLMLYPLYGHLIAERGRTHPGEARWWFGASAAVQAIVTVLYLTHATTGWMQRFMPDPGRDEILAEQADWSALRTDLYRRGMLDPARYAVVATDWHHCVRLDYALAGALPVACIADGPMPASDDLIDEPDGRALILVSRSPDLGPADAARVAHVASLAPLGPVDIHHNGVVALRVWLFVAGGREE